MTYPTLHKTVDDITKYDVDEIFDLGAATSQRISLRALTNQFIHAYVIVTEFAEDGNLIGVLLCSDWEKNDTLIQIPIKLAIEIVEDVITDDITSIHSVRNPRTGEMRKVSIL